MLMAMTEYKQNPNITAGVFYPAELLFDGLYTITDDTGYQLIIPKGKPSSHLNGDAQFNFFSVLKIGNLVVTVGV